MGEATNDRILQWRVRRYAGLKALDGRNAVQRPVFDEQRGYLCQVGFPFFEVTGYPDPYLISGDTYGVGIVLQKIFQIPLDIRGHHVAVGLRGQLPIISPVCHIDDRIDLVIYRHFENFLFSLRVLVVIWRCCG